THAPRRRCRRMKVACGGGSMQRTVPRRRGVVGGPPQYHRTGLLRFGGSEEASQAPRRPLAAPAGDTLSCWRTDQGCEPNGPTVDRARRQPAVELTDAPVAPE